MNIYFANEFFTPWLWINISSKKTASPIHKGTFHWTSILQSSLQWITKSRAKLTQCQDLAKQPLRRSDNLSIRLENSLDIFFGKWLYPRVPDNSIIFNNERISMNWIEWVSHTNRLIIQCWGPYWLINTVTLKTTFYFPLRRH